MDGGQLVAEAARDRIRAAAEFLDPSQFGLLKGSNEYFTNGRFYFQAILELGGWSLHKYSSS